MMNVHSIVNLTSFIINILLGLISILRSAKSRINQVYFIMVTSIAITSLGYYKMLTSGSAWLEFALSANCISAVNIVMFSGIYGRYGQSLLHKLYIIVLYIFSAVIIFMLVIGLIKFEYVSDQSSHGFIFSRSGSIIPAYMLICALISLVNLENTYRHIKQVNRLKYPAIIFIGTLAFLVLIYSLALGYPYVHIDVHSTAVIIIGISNIFLSYPVIRHSSIKIQVDRSIIAKSYTLLLVGIYLIVLGLLGKIVQIIGKSLNYFLAFITAFIIILVIIVAILSKSIKLRIRLFIERHFYKSKYDYRAEWEKFSKNIFSVLDIRELANRIIETVSSAINADSAYMLMLDENSRAYFVVNDEVDITIPADNEMFDWIWRYGSPVKIQNGVIKAIKTFSNPPAVPQYIAKEDGLCVPIIAESKLIAIIVLRTTVPITTEDIDLIEIMANQISIAMTNARKSQELTAKKELESFSKLSSFVLHDLKSSSAMLSLIVDNAVDNFDNPEFQKDALKTMRNVVGRIQRIISNLSREVETRPPVLTDVNEIVESAINASGVMNITRIRLVKELNAVSKVMVDPENIERVIINLIVNGIEAITGQGEIKIATSVESGYACITISDTGCGMTQEFIRYRLFQPFVTTKAKGIGIGLYQSKMIVNSYGGVIEVTSKQGQGSIFTVKLPISEVTI